MISSLRGVILLQRFFPALLAFFPAATRMPFRPARLLWRRMSFLVRRGTSARRRSVRRHLRCRLRGWRRRGFFVAGMDAAYRRRGRSMLRHLRCRLGR